MNVTLKKIEKLRALMIQSGLENGFHNIKTIRLSKKVDELHNQYNKEKGYPQSKQSPAYKYYEN